MTYKDYSDYLKTRSKKALIYRNFYLYPRLQKDLKNPVLDVGCGVGDYLRYNKKAIGSDVNKILIKNLKKEGLKSELIIKNKLNFKDNRFNSVIMDNVLEHIEEPLPLIQEIYRVLKFNGIFLVGLPGIKGYKNDPDHKKNYNYSELNKLIEPVGFRFKKIKKMPLNILFLSRIMRQFCIYTYFVKTH